MTTPSTPCCIVTYNADGSVYHITDFPSGQDASVTATLADSGTAFWGITSNFYYARTRTQAIDPGTWTNGSSAPLGA